LIKNPKKPFIAIVGGGKASDKLGVIKHLKNKVDYFLLGGAPANTLYFLQGGDVGKSLVDRDQEHDKEIKKLLRYKNIVSPIDYQFEKDAILDIGQNTVALYKKYISKARTVLWSGPMGLVERKKFAMGSKAIAQAIIQNKKAISISGGGETVEFLKKNKFDAHFSFISTGGTAMLDFLAGEKLPGIEILRR
jgi:phosphoglycerate kinase